MAALRCPLSSLADRGTAARNEAAAYLAVTLVRRVRIVIGAAATIACASGDTESFDMPALNGLPEGSPSGLQLEPRRVLGSARGLLAFGRIGRAAISAGGVIAITDLDTCEIVLLDQRDARPLKRFGRCGTGFGEMRAVTSMHFVGDTLVTFDGRQRQLIKWSTDGAELHRQAVQVAGTNAGIPEVWVVNDSQLLVVSSVYPRLMALSEGESSSTFLHLISARSGEVVRAALEPPPVGRDNTSRVVNNTSACVRPTRADQVVVAINEWKFEAAILSLPGLAPRGRIGSRVSWTGMAQNAGSAVSIPASRVVSASCAPTLVALWHARRTTSPEQRPSVRLEIRDYAGRMLLDFERPEIDGVVLERVLAMTDSVVLFRGQSAGRYPVVVEMALRESNAIARRERNRSE